MTGCAVVYGKEVCQFLVDICGIGVQFLVDNVLVAILAGILFMGRDTKLPDINQPGSLNYLSTENQGE
jgi:hypothetical protein